MNALDFHLFMTAPQRKLFCASSAVNLPLSVRDAEKELIQLMYLGPSAHLHAQQRLERVLCDLAPHAAHERLRYTVVHVAIEALSARALPALLVVARLVYELGDPLAAAAFVFRLPFRSDLVRRLHVMGAHPSVFARDVHDVAATTGAAAASDSAATATSAASQDDRDNDDASSVASAASSVSSADSTLGIRSSTLPAAALRELCRSSSYASPWADMLARSASPDDVARVLGDIVLRGDDWSAVDALVQAWTGGARAKLTDLLLLAFDRAGMATCVALFRLLLAHAGAQDEDVVVLAWLALTSYRTFEPDGRVRCAAWLDQPASLVDCAVQDAVDAVRPLLLPSAPPSATPFAGCAAQELQPGYRARIAPPRRERTSIAHLVDIDQLTGDDGGGGGGDAVAPPFVSGFVHVVSLRSKRGAPSYVACASLLAEQGRRRLLTRPQLFKMRTQSAAGADWAGAVAASERSATEVALSSSSSSSAVGGTGAAAEDPDALDRDPYDDAAPDAVRALVRDHAALWTKVTHKLQLTRTQTRLATSARAEPVAFYTFKNVPFSLTVDFARAHNANLYAVTPSAARDQGDDEQVHQEQQQDQDQEQDAVDDHERDIFGVRPSAKRLRRLLLLSQQDAGASVVHEVRVRRSLHQVCGSDWVSAARVMVSLLALRGVSLAAAPLGVSLARIVRFREGDVNALSIDVPQLYPELCYSLHLRPARRSERASHRAHDDHHSLSTDLKPVAAAAASEGDDGAALAIDRDGLPQALEQTTIESLLALCIVRFFTGASSALIPAPQQLARTVALTPYRATDFYGSLTGADASDATWSAPFSLCASCEQQGARLQRLMLAVPAPDCAADPALQHAPHAAASASLTPSRAQKVLSLLEPFLRISTDDQLEPPQQHKLMQQRLRDRVGEIVASVMQDLTSVELSLSDTLVRVHRFPLFVARHVARELGDCLAFFRARVLRASHERTAHQFLSAIS